MRTATFILAGAIVSAVFGSASGHGIPITVNVNANNQLVATNTQPLYLPDDLAKGFAQMVLVDNEDGAVMSSKTITISNPYGLFGTYRYTNLPGFDVYDMTPGSDLRLEVIPQPVKDTNPVETRMLWHWSLALSQSDPPSNPVVADPAGESLVIGSDPGGVIQTITVPQSGDTPTTIKIAVPLGNQLGVHEHYLDYYLQDPPADAGLYGFFARLTSPNYAPSDPFLVILDDKVYEDDYPGQILAGALAINNAALLAGDYNHDDRVDAADYVVWRKSLNSTTQLAADGSDDAIVDMADLGIWRANFGLSFPAAGSGVSIGQAAPEPTTGLLVVFAVLAGSMATVRRRG